MNANPSSGLVVLVGAGPGDPGLMTLAGASWLAKAEVVVYDRLVAPALLALAPEEAELIYVGKGRAGNVMSQKEINALLISLARAGRLVVRLKGGDPFIFGRGAEEALALVEAGVVFRVVPGVTAASGATAYAGIPLTERGLSSSVALVTGQEDPTRAGTRIDYKSLAGVNTLVFYMGVENLPEIAAGLLAAGRSGDTPAALIERGTTARQRTVVATLATLAEAATRENVRPPALIVVGEVVGLREKLSWRPLLPLSGRTILVTRTRGQASRLSAQLAELGAEALEAPTIAIRPPEDWSAVDAALARLDEYHLVCLTSSNGVEAFFSRAMELGLDARRMAKAKVAAVGAGTAEALRRWFIRADLVPEVFTTEAMAQALSALGDITGRRVLLARAEIASPALPEGLRRAGAVVDELTVYRTVRPDALPPPAVEALRDGRVNWITFTSSSTVDNFCALAEKLVEPAARPSSPKSGGLAGLLAGIRLASIGPVTTATLREHGLAPAVEAEPHDIPGLVAAIVRAEGESPAGGGP